MVSTEVSHSPVFTQSGSFSERLRAGLTPLVDVDRPGDKGSVTSPTPPIIGNSLTSLDTAVTEPDMGATIGCESRRSRQKLEQTTQHRLNT